MKRYWLKGLILILFISGVCLAAQTQSSKQTTKAEQEIVQVVKDYYAAWNSGNLDKAGEYYAKGPDRVYYDVAPLKYNSWAEYRAGVEKIFLANYTEVKLEPYDDLKVERRGSIAWTTLTFKLSGNGKDGKKLELDCRHTAIWEKQGSKWVVVHEHVSAPLQSS